MARSGKVRIGISGWRYKPWRGVFYPEDLKQKDELSFAADCFPTIEINGTFYSLQRPQSFAQWATDTPKDFVFAVKGPRYITHIRRLKDVEKPLANFFASGVFELGAKLGPILWQFPPNFKFDAERLETFFKLLPRDTTEAARLARRHDSQVKGRASLKPMKKIRLRHAMEIRHDSFRAPDFVKLLRKYKVALVVADTVEWPCLMDLTSDFIYCRLHGSEELYASGYDSRALTQWGKRVVAWAQGSEPKDAKRILDKAAPKRAKRDVYVYFDNDMKVKAPGDATKLTKRVEKALA
ncbi:MAG: DUF72 domain-containing protein [Rhodospirillaceae bacterium]|nr:MAG: DUF72 domain-containing protein [Rhodospirillaceae bacterium]